MTYLTQDQIEDRLSNKIFEFTIHTDSLQDVKTSYVSKIKELKQISPVNCAEFSFVKERIKVFYCIDFNHKNPKLYIVTKFIIPIGLGGYIRSEVIISIFESYSVSDCFTDEIKYEINTFLSNIPTVDEFLSKRYFPSYTRSVQFLTVGDGIESQISISGDDSSLRVTEFGISTMDAFVMSYIRMKRLLLQKV